ncbi:MAG TPA: alpha/beta hydrolase-fold protein [Acidimicrobiales bacterium]|nr:alpha/beta hydrolase-fold protein [Acidimicrobiales bacterium]
MRLHGAAAGVAATTMLGAACGGGAATTTKPASAQVINTTYPSASLHSNRNVMVLLPPGYQSSRRYPVVEFLHGIPGGPDEMIGTVNMNVVSNQSKTPFIAVAPDGNGPMVTDSEFANTTRQPMGTVTGPELRSWVDSHYSTDRTWYVTGLSTGGFGAPYLPTLSPGAYTAACPVSGAFDARGPGQPFSDDQAFVGQPASVRQAASPILHVSANGPRTLVVTGSSDTLSFDPSNRYVAAMRAVGQPNKLIVEPGGHEDRVWRAGNRQCIRYFFAASGISG